MHTRLSYAARSQHCTNPTTKQLLDLMERKRTNLALSIDVTTAAELLDIVGRLGALVCVVKTHIDILEDFTPALTQQLSALAQEHQFLLFEDRKFADIGSTVALQYGAGLYKIADWAPITNAHSVPGDGIVQGLAKIGMSKGNGLLLLAEMSSRGSLATGAYTDATIAMARAYPDFVIGFVSQRKLVDDPHLLYFTPGVHLAQPGDALGQQYRTPAQAILEQQSDIIIVGRGIYAADDPVAAAEQYRAAGWQAYEQDLQDSQAESSK